MPPSYRNLLFICCFTWFPKTNWKRHTTVPYFSVPCCHEFIKICSQFMFYRLKNNWFQNGWLQFKFNLLLLFNMLKKPLNNVFSRPSCWQLCKSTSRKMNLLILHTKLYVPTLNQTDFIVVCTTVVQYI